MFPSRLVSLTLCALTLSTGSTQAERLDIRPADIWDEWTYSPGALHLDGGTLRTVLVGKNTDPLPGATLRGAGAALATAARAFDGDPATGWSPAAGTALEDWWIEIDLGQVLPVQTIRLRFDESAPPPGLLYPLAVKRRALYQQRQRHRQGHPALQQQRAHRLQRGARARNRSRQRAGPGPAHRSHPQN